DARAVQPWALEKGREPIIRSRSLGGFETIIEPRVANALRGRRSCHECRPAEREAPWTKAHRSSVRRHLLARHGGVDRRSSVGESSDRSFRWAKAEMPSKSSSTPAPCILGATC